MKNWLYDPNEFQRYRKSSSSILLKMAILWVIGISILAADYYLVDTGTVYPFYELFWIGILLCGFSTFYLVLEDISIKYKILFLFLFGFSIYLIKVLRSPNFYSFQDEIYHFQTVKLIYQMESLDVHLTSFELPKYYPGIELLTVSLKYISGISLFESGILLVGLLHSSILIFIYLIFKNVVKSERVAVLGAYIYAANISYSLMDALFSYESLGVLLVLILIFLISKDKEDFNNITYTKKFIFLSTITIPSLVITHHFSSYMFLVFMIILCIANVHMQSGNKAINQRSWIKLTTFLATLIFSWIVYNASITIRYFNTLFINTINDILILTLSQGTTLRMPFRQYQLPFYEEFIDTFLYIPLLSLLFILGVWFIKNEKKKQNEFTYALIIFGSFMFLGFFSTFISRAYFLRSFPFLFIGVSFAAAIALDNILYNVRNKYLNNASIKILVYFIVGMILIGGISIGNKPSTRVPYTVLASGPSAITLDLISASDWFKKLDNNDNVVSDIAVNWVFSTYGEQQVNSYVAWRIFFPTTIDKNVSFYLQDFRFLIADERMSKFLAEYRYYFDEKELSLKGLPPYGRTQPLPKASLDKFNNNSFIYKIYSIGNINIYRIELPKKQLLD